MKSRSCTVMVTLEVVLGCLAVLAVVLCLQRFDLIFHASYKFAGEEIPLLTLSKSFVQLFYAFTAAYIAQFSIRSLYPRPWSKNQWARRLCPMLALLACAAAIAILISTGVVEYASFR